MGTVADTVYDAINDNWGNGGYSGNTPQIDTTETQTSEDTTSTDVVLVRHWSLREKPRQFNDTYTNRYYFIDILVKSKTSAAQLKLLVDEVEYLLRNTTMTDLEFRNLEKDYTVSSWGYGEHAVLLTLELASYVSSGAITSSTSGSTDLTVGGDLQVNGNDIKDSSGNTVLSFDGSGDLDVLNLGDSLTLAYLKDLLMWGSDNAAWVVAVLLSENDPYGSFHGTWKYENDGVNDTTTWYLVPLPCSKGSLRLYIAEMRLYMKDADANNYISTLRVYGVKATDGSIAYLAEDPTNHNSVGAVTWDPTDVDMSSYSQCLIRVTTVVDTDAALEFTWPEVKCYYDT